MGLIVQILFLFSVVSAKAVDHLSVNGECVLKEEKIKFYCEGQTVNETLATLQTKPSPKVKTKSEACSSELVKLTVDAIKEWEKGNKGSSENLITKALSRNSKGAVKLEPNSCTVLWDKEGGLKTILFDIGIHSKSDEDEISERLVVIASLKNSKIEIRTDYYSTDNTEGEFYSPLNICDVDSDGRADIAIREMMMGRRRDVLIHKNLGEAGYSKVFDIRFWENAVCGC